MVEPPPHTPKVYILNQRFLFGKIIISVQRNTKCAFRNKMKNNIPRVAKKLRWLNTDIM